VVLTLIIAGACSHHFHLSSSHLPAFFAAGCASLRRLNSALHQLSSLGSSPDISATGLHLRRQIVGTVAVVFFTFLLRACMSVVLALANAFNNSGQSDCPGFQNLCSSCRFVSSNATLQVTLVLTRCCSNEANHALAWLDFTPQFQLSIVLISSPLALLVALWGMTSQRMLQLIATSHLAPSSSSLLLPAN
jgi:hypothetical protein